MKPVAVIVAVALLVGCASTPPTKPESKQQLILDVPAALMVTPPPLKPL